MPGNAGDTPRPGFNPWVGKVPWRRAWQPTPVFLPGESHGQRSLERCSPCGACKESDTTEHTYLRRGMVCRGEPGQKQCPFQKSQLDSCLQMRSARMAAGSARMSKEQERVDGMQDGEKGQV